MSFPTAVNDQITDSVTCANRTITMRLKDTTTGEDVEVHMSVGPTIDETIYAIRGFLMAAGFHPNLVNEYVPDGEASS